MRRGSNQQPLKQVIEAFLKKNGLGKKMERHLLIDHWAAIMGPVIAKHTLEVFFNNSVLHVRLDSSTLRQELHMEKTKVVEVLNEDAGKKIVSDIVFT